MPPRLLHPDEYELVGRDSNESSDTFDLDEADFQSQGLTSTSYLNRRRSRIPRVFSRIAPSRLRGIFSARNRNNRRTPKPTQHPRPRFGIHRPSRRLCLTLLCILVGFLILALFTALFRPSYTNPPAYYRALRERIETSNDHYNQGNPENQKIFIAASIYDEDGHLLDGAWGEAVLELLNLLGNRNVYMSIYENTAGENAQTAEFKFERKLQCQHTLIYEDPPPLDEFSQITLPNGSKRTKRVAYLAEARNRALEPLWEHPEVKYDKLLYLNDAVFDPIQAVQLLFATNLNEHGHTAYRAACAVDFINPFKFYDTYATRDLEGFSMGLPLFPWFSTAGNGYSRADVLAGKDAVRVKSCWGGMVAFDAKPFQADPPLRFRATEDLYWDASECCLIHADLLSHGTFEEDGEYVGVFMNPYVRVAYDNVTLSWLPTIQRFERIFSIPQNIINHLVGLPWFNPRRTESAGSQAEDEVWIPDKSLTDGGSFQKQSREAKGDGYCGKRMLQVIKETPRNGEKNWENMPIPSG